MPRIYKQGVASLGFDHGPSVTLRINPSDVKWNFKINTSITETVGGRVMQVLGANISDLTVSGFFGEVRGGGKHTQSWQLAEQFLTSVQRIAEYQSGDSTVQGKILPRPAIFNFPPKGWRFEVYVTSLVDSSGGAAVTHTPGRFSYDYTLTMSIVNDLSNTTRVIGNGNGDLKYVKDAAIESYINRIADGIGWKSSDYNGPGATTSVVSTATSSGKAATPVASTVTSRPSPSPSANKPHAER